MKRRALLGTALSSLLLSACVYGKNFDLEWDEEVQLHDGRTIVVHLKYTYRRLYQGLTPYSGTNQPLDTTLSFDAGIPTGVVTQWFKGFLPMFLGQYDGVWYAVLYGNYYDDSRKVPGQDWGEMEGPYGQWAIKLIDGAWKPISMAELPSVFQTPNVLMLYGSAQEHADFAGHRVTLQDKANWLEKHPLGYADVRLTRPTASSIQRQGTASPAPPGASK